MEKFSTKLIEKQKGMIIINKKKPQLQFKNKDYLLKILMMLMLKMN